MRDGIKIRVACSYCLSVQSWIRSLFALVTEAEKGLSLPTSNRTLLISYTAKGAHDSSMARIGYSVVQRVIYCARIKAQLLKEEQHYQQHINPNAIFMPPPELNFIL